MPLDITFDQKRSAGTESFAATTETTSIQQLSTAVTEKVTHFLGFEDKAAKLRELWYRWKALEAWVELAVLPSEIHPDDQCLLAYHKNTRTDGDDYIEDLARLRKRSSFVQNLFNNQLSELSIETTRWESSLVVQPSQIPGAGMGLFYHPLSHRRDTSESTNINDAKKILPSGSVVCYYTGMVHTHSSASGLQDKSYLMWIRGNTLVDPKSMPHIKARYINDPLNDNIVNCAYCPAKIPNRKNDEEVHEDTIRTSVVTTRDILPGEELFVSYGDVYWSKQPVCGSRLVLRTAKEEISIDEEEKESDSGSEEDSDDDIDETFPFSPLF